MGGGEEVIDIHGGCDGVFPFRAWLDISTAESDCQDQP